jgi:hypothetical protein
MPGAGQVYIDQALTNLSKRYSNKEFIADQVFPVTQVDRETGLYWVYDQSNLRVEQSSRRGMAHSNEVDYGTTTATYGPLLEHSLRIGIPKAMLEQAQSPLEPRTDATMTLSEKIEIEKEKALNAILTNTSLITQNQTLSGSGQFSDYANSDPFAIIQAMFDGMVQNGLVMPNTLTMGWPVWSKMRNHPDLIERVKYAGGGSAIKTINPSDLGELFGVERILVGKAVENTAKEGQPASKAFIWGKHLYLSYVDSGSDIRSITGGRTLVLNGARAVYNWTDDEPGVGEWVKVSDQYQHFTVATEAISACYNAVA